MYGYKVGDVVRWIRPSNARREQGQVYVVHSISKDGDLRVNQQETEECNGYLHTCYEKVLRVIVSIKPEEQTVSTAGYRVTYNDGTTEWVKA